MPVAERHRREHRFGGDWTTKKLNALAGYLRAYMIALKGKPFERIYIDAFAGTGYRTPKRDILLDPLSDESLFPEFTDQEGFELLDGSARIALTTNPPFDRYIFIERSPERCARLNELREEFSHLRERIEIRQGEANEEIRNLCRWDWRARRAVLFLDPYGMEVEWTTIVRVALTRAIDLWVLFPLGVGVNRLLVRSGEIPESWRRRLDLIFGTTEWFDAFYRVQSTPTLFEPDAVSLVKASMEEIGRFYNTRLAKVFAAVAENPGVLRNSRNNPLYLLCFAVANPSPKAIEPALRIANHLLRDLR